MPARVAPSSVYTAVPRLGYRGGTAATQPGGNAFRGVGGSVSILGHTVDIRSHIRKDPVLAVALVLAVASCAAVPPDAGYAGYVDLRTLGLLFSLMAVMAGLSGAGVFRVACRRLLASVQGPRRLALSLVALTFLSSMLITNDVALVTFVPFALLALASVGSARFTCFIVVLMTVAANLGSMFTPVGNPQNLYLYSASHMGLAEFLALMAPYTAASLALLVATVALLGRAMLDADGAADEGESLGGIEEGPAPTAVRVVPWLAVFALALAAVARVLPYQVAVVAAVAVGVAFDRGALARVDYGLLLTFVAFFVFVGNMGRIEAVDAFIARTVEGHALAVSVVASQVLSNVPCAILLSGFTADWPALIVGTNIGGLGTLIASMASLISYKQLAVWLPREKGRYLAMFTAANVSFLVVLAALAALLGSVA